MPVIAFYSLCCALHACQRAMQRRVACPVSLRATEQPRPEIGQGCVQESGPHLSALPAGVQRAAACAKAAGAPCAARAAAALMMIREGTTQAQTCK